MTLEQQVTNLELSEKLKDLGVKQNSLFHWVKYRSTGVIMPWFRAEVITESNSIEIMCSAFTVAELGEMLPVRIEDDTWLSCTKSLNGFGEICERISYDKWEDKKNYLAVIHVHEIIGIPYTKYENQKISEADLRAKMLIYLIKNSLITL